jgi:cobalt-precorrin 5A hydrolase
MKIALISLSREGADLLRSLGANFLESRLFLHETVPRASRARRFTSIIDLTREIFHEFDGLVYAAPCGVVVRAISPNLRDKRTDPAVVVVDAGGRFAISLVSGHEGGGNALAIRVSNLLGAEPVITTTTEALKPLIVGVGCRRETEAFQIVTAVKEALRQAGADLSQVRLLASADVKADEKGLAQAATEMGIPLRFIRSEEIRASAKAFARSSFVEKKVNLPAVAEPAALLAGRRTRLILPKTTYRGVTVAVARESFSWSESGPEAPSIGPAGPKKRSPAAR